MSSPPPAWPGAGLRADLGREEASRAQTPPGGLGLESWGWWGAGSSVMLRIRQAPGKTWAGWVWSLSLSLSLSENCGCYYSPKTLHNSGAAPSSLCQALSGV